MRTDRESDYALAENAFQPYNLLHLPNNGSMFNIQDLEEDSIYKYVDAKLKIKSSDTCLLYSFAGNTALSTDANKGSENCPMSTSSSQKNNYDDLTLICQNMHKGYGAKNQKDKYIKFIGEKLTPQFLSKLK